LTEQLEELYNRVGRLESGRIGVKLTKEVAEKLQDKLSQDPPDIGGRRIENTNRIDGVKFIFADESWMLLRPSGTEPMVRIYAVGELINEDKIILGGEESAGLSIKGHYPEKDGILACLLAAEAVAARGASLTEQLEELYNRVGRLESGRIGVKLTKEVAEKLQDKLSQDPPDIGGRRIENTNRIDGVKFIFADESWMLLRPSGTEPMVRIYAESENKDDLEVLLEQGRRYLLG
jgi:phosphomannomutase